MSKLPFPPRLANNLKIAARNLSRNKFYSGLNILGLAVGFAVFIFGMAYVYFETHFEDFHTNRNSVYRATYRYTPTGGYESHWARIPFDYINNLPEDVPGVKALVRFQNHARKYIRIGQDKFSPKHAYVADNDVLKIFNFDLLSGDASTALTKPHSVVISQTLALRYFGNADPLGKQIFVIGDLDSVETLHHVTGVMKDLPSNTHLPVDMLISFRDNSERVGWAYTYILLEPGVDIGQVTSHMPSFIRKYSTKEEAKNDAIVFQALPDIHLTSDLARELIPNGKLLYVRIVGFSSILILVIAAINYMNLSSAMSLGRAKEVGMRKIMGATSRELYTYLLNESVIHNLIALAIGGILIFCLWPFLQGILSIDFLPPLFTFVPFMMVIAILLGLLTGIYPTVLLLALKPVTMLKTTKVLAVAHTKRKFSLKRVMITAQFAVSILLLGSALIAYKQFEYLKEKSLGIAREQIVAIPGVPDQVKDKFETFKNQLSNEKGILGVSACMQVPSTEIRDAGPVLIEGVNSDPSKAPIMDIQIIDPDFASLLGLTFVSGGNVNPLPPAEPPTFSEAFSIQDYLLQQPREYLINETAMRALGWNSASEPIDNQISWSIGDMKLAPGVIKGVVKDFHQESLKNKVDPMILVQEPVWLRTFLVKIQGNDVQSSVEKIRATWDKLFPFYPMDYYFLDDLYNNLYKNDRVQLQVLFMFSTLAILIAFTGLVGLVAYALKTRTKELAVRQVLGAQLRDLIRLMSVEYVVVLLIGGMVAVPLSIYILRLWLEGFAYRIDISAGSYVLAIASIIALLFTTVSIQTWQASTRNPARTLREE